MLIDTHCHLNLPDAFPDPAEAIVEAVAEGVERIVVVGVDRESSLRAIELSSTYDSVYAVVGWHPNYAKSFRGDADLAELRVWLTQPKVVAMGEIGLDYHWDYATRVEQWSCLNAQLEVAQEVGCRVVFHCREAYPDLLSRLEEVGPGPYLLHCFAGDPADADRARKLGCSFGVDGPIGYPKAHDLRSIVAALPRDRIVVETDAPYLSPIPFRGKPNRPAFVRFVNNALASCLGIDAESCAALTTANAERFFQF